MSTLNTDDINILLDALDAYIENDEAMGVTGILMSIMMSNSKEEAHSRTEEYRRNVDKGKDERRRKNEIVTLLKAKLIMMRDQAEAKQFETSVLDGG